MITHESHITEEEMAKLESLFERQIETDEDYQELGETFDEDE